MAGSPAPLLQPAAHLVLACARVRPRWGLEPSQWSRCPSPSPPLLGAAPPLSVLHGTDLSPTANQGGAASDEADAPPPRQGGFYISASVSSTTPRRGSATGGWSPKQAPSSGERGEEEQLSSSCAPPHPQKLLYCSLRLRACLLEITRK